MKIDYRQHALTIAKKPMTRRIAISFGTFFLLFGLFGYFILPGVIKSQAEKQIAEKLQRTVSIEKIEVSPYAMAVTVHNLKLMERDESKVFASFEELKVNISLQSLFRFAPVVQEVQLTKPYIHLARTSANHYNIDDIIALIAKQPPSDKPARFSVYNIQIEGGQIEFDDRPEKIQHIITDLKIGIPFISSLPSKLDVHVEPLLSAIVNGSPLKLTGKVRPFAETREATIHIDLDNVNLPKYIEYLPFEPRFKLPSAKIDMNLVASFQQAKNQTPALILNGSANLKSLTITELDGKPMVKVPELAITLGDVNIMAGKIDIAKIVLNAPELNVVAESGGSLNLMRLTPPPSKTATKSSDGQQKAAGPQIKLHEFTIKDAALKFEDALSAHPVSVSMEKFNLDVKGIAADLGKYEVTIDEVASNSASFDIINNKGKPQKMQRTSGKPAAPADSEQPFTVTIANIAISEWRAKMEDRSLKKPAVTIFSPLSLVAQNVSTKAGSKGTLDLKAAVNQAGSLNVKGDLAIVPLQANLKLDLKEVDVLALQPYFTEQVNLLVTSANVSTNGTLQLSQGKDGAFKGEFKGDATMGKVATVDKISASDFVRWKSLSLGGVQARLDPFSLSIEKVALNDYFARVIVSQQGRINLQDIVRGADGEKKSLTESEPVKETRWDATEPETATPSSEQIDENANKPKAASKIPPIKIRRLTLAGGKVRFTDNYIKPNFTANLVDLGGTIIGLSSDPDSSANVDVRGKVNSAPLTINGKVNPLKGDLFLDLKAEVKGMELAPLSAYSGKYAGYGIEKGQLTFDVSYKVEDRKLTAENRLVLDQLTFGNKVDSPQATKLPVMLAVSLLKDRNGVIDIKLPISGSLDDPKFSLGGVIVRVIVNLLTKAITSPFALLGSAFGGGEELGWMEFDPGRFRIPEAGEAKLATLAKALNDRPALKLEITGRTDPSVDREGLARVNIDRKVRALKIKDMVAKGQSAPEGRLEITKEEYPKLLKRVYSDEKFKKPRNALFLEKDLPVPEMEKLMIDNAQTTGDDLTALGNQRAQAVKEWLVSKGKVPVERVFILASKSTDKAAAKAKPSRVDFSLK